jgi:hypothetical protein
LASPDRAEWKSRFTANLSAVRIRNSARAAQSARDVDAAAYAVGNHIMFGRGMSKPSTRFGRHVLAHELAHVVSTSHGASDVVERYRPKGSFAYGERDTKALVEQPFDTKIDKETKPGIQLVEVELTGTQTDAGGAVFSTGTATVAITPTRSSSPVRPVGFGRLGRNAIGCRFLHRPSHRGVRLQQRQRIGESRRRLQVV